MREHGLVFTSTVGTELYAANVRRGSRRIATVARSGRQRLDNSGAAHGFVSLLSDHKVPIEVISRLVGHKYIKMTELIYRHQIRPVVEEGATEMDRIFPKPPRLQAPNDILPAWLRSVAHELFKDAGHQGYVPDQPYESNGNQTGRP